MYKKSEPPNFFMSPQARTYNRFVMIFIALILGILGTHRYLMGHRNWHYYIWIFVCCLLLPYVPGVDKALAKWAWGVPFVWNIVDIFLILTGVLKMADGRELSEGQ
jgi:hypothetical protein